MKRPNFLLLFPDQWRWDWLGCVTSPYGRVPVRTPVVDAMARRGALFENCRSNSPVCAPARACLSLGVRYQRCGVPSNSFDLEPSRVTSWRLLREAGYRTLTSGKNDLHKKTRWKGLDGWTDALHDYGFTDAIDQSGKIDSLGLGLAVSPHCSYSQYLHERELFEVHRADYVRRARESTHFTAEWPSPMSREHYTDDFCARNALRLLERVDVGQPWMLWVNFPGPHDPFDPPRELQQRYDGVRFPDPVDGRETYNGKPVNHQQIRRNYAAECEGIDEWCGRLIDEVTRRGELENTYIIFCSDHGEMLGDHGRFSKSVPQEGSVHVPLVVAGPDVPRGERRDEPVELIDIAAFMLRRAGVQIPTGWEALPMLEGERRREQFAALGDWEMVCTGRHKLVRRRTEAGSELSLFDLHDDPQERVNLAIRLPAITADLQARLDAVAAG